MHKEREDVTHLSRSPVHTSSRSAFTVLIRLLMKPRKSPQEMEESVGKSTRFCSSTFTGGFTARKVSSI